MDTLSRGPGWVAYTVLSVGFLSLGVWRLASNQMWIGVITIAFGLIFALFALRRWRVARAERARRVEGTADGSGASGPAKE